MCLRHNKEVRGTGVSRRESRGGEVCELKQQSLTFWHQGPVSWKTIFPQTMEGKGGCFGDNSVIFRLLCTLFLLYYIVICNEILVQLTIMQNQWELVFLPLNGPVLGRR